MDINKGDRTTEAPVLSQTHPLRRAFTRYGRYVARHVLATLLISVAFALLLVYPCPFLYTTDFTSGASNMPHHVWTDAQPLYGAVSEPDVIMRSIWVHGSYMEVLNREVLLGALELQDELLGPTRNFNPRQTNNSVALPDESVDLAPQDRDKFHVLNGLTNQSWFFHSPLQYWACSAENIAADPNIVVTVNEKKTQSTSVNVTLRHSIVFSGKRFEDRRLVAADALVITLIHLRDSPVGKQWERKLADLAARMRHKWTIIPADGWSMSSQLYEFQFKPISGLDRALLTLAYCIMVIYFISSFSKLRAVKSKLGLFVTAWVQILASLVSSLTICAIFKVDLSRLPYAAYPLVVLAISLENSFRLINAVIMTPADHSISSRIGEAFGETAHVAVAGRAQNLIILWGLSKITFPGVSAFCTFAALAIVFDFFYLSTFFLSVLSIDVQRTELSDALEKASSVKLKPSDKNQMWHSWADAVLQGKIALSTRIAGTVVMLGFVFIAEWHFIEDRNILRMLSRVFNNTGWSHQQTPPRSSLLIDIHQARSPTSWLRLQDHETAREVISVVKPWATSYTARVYDPLVFVLKGSDRMPHNKERLLLPAAYDFIHHELPRFIVVVLVVVALVRLLMNYLLWDDIVDSKIDDEPEAEPLVSVKSLSAGHMLDITMLTASSNGCLVSVGLDRVIQVWNVRSDSRSRVISDPENPMEDPFPVLAMAVDKAPTWLALLSRRMVRLWNMDEQRWGPSMTVDMEEHKPIAFFFDPRPTATKPVLIIVRRTGTMLELDFGAKSCVESLICRSPLLCAAPVEEKGERYPRPDYSRCAHFTNFASHVAPSSQSAPRMSILTASRKSCIHQVNNRDNIWLSEDVKFPSREERDVQSLTPISACSAYLIARLRTVDLVDLKTSEIIHTFQTEPIQHRSLKFLRSRRRQTQCGSQGLASFTLAYVSAETSECILQTYLPPEEGETICFCSQSEPRPSNCCLWRDTKEIKRRVENPGDWEALPNGSVMGVRRKATRPSTEKEKGGRGISSSPPRNDFRRRRRSQSRPPDRREDDWEVWVMSQLEKEENFETRPLASPEEDRGVGGGEHLMVSKPGPMQIIGSCSVAVAFGDVIKVIAVGHERFDGPADRLTTDNLMTLANRRRRTAGSLRIKSAPWPRMHGY